MAYRVRQGRSFVTPPTGFSYTGSFLYQMDHLGQEGYKPSPTLSKALDILFILHADHEMNASYAFRLAILDAVDLITSTDRLRFFKLGPRWWIRIVALPLVSQAYTARFMVGSMWFASRPVLTPQSA